MTEDLTGAVNLLKPPGMTSHDAVALARRYLGTRRVGHTGTLDPLAAGVLVLVVGRLTRAARYFTALTKRYRAEAVFGIRTSSGDLDGEILERSSARSLEPGVVREAAAALTGTIEQLPPLASAVRVSGRRLYEWARAGGDTVVSRPVRRVRVERFGLLDWTDGEHPRGLFDVVCGSGTYIRALIDALGQRLGTGATIAFLLRTAVGPFEARDAWTLEELRAGCRHGERNALLGASAALAFLPAVVVPPDRVRDVAHGRPIPLPVDPAALPQAPLRLIDDRGRLLAIARPVAGAPERASGPRTVRYEAVLIRPEELSR